MQLGPWTTKEKRSMHATLNLKSGLSFMCEDDAKLAKAMTRQGEMKSRWNQSDDNEMKEIIQNCFGNLWAATSGTLYDPHYDLTQNLQLQLHGRKRWVFLSPRHFEASGLRMHPLNHPRHRRAYGWAADSATPSIPTRRSRKSDVMDFQINETCRRV